MPVRMSFDRVAHCYDDTRAMPPTAAAAVTAGIADALRAVSPAPIVLEVGIGTGRIAVPLTAAGVRMVGIDVAQAMVARLREKQASIPLALAESTRLPFRPAAFGAVLFVHVLHLVADPAASLRAALPHLTRDGLLILGRNHYPGNPVRQMYALSRELVRELTGTALPDPASRQKAGDRAFQEVARAARCEVAEHDLARWSEQTTARTLLSQVANRVYSATWTIPEAAMPELLRRLAPRLEGLLGGLDRVVEYQATFRMVTARLPG